MTKVFMLIKKQTAILVIVTALCVPTSNRRNFARCRGHSSDKNITWSITHKYLEQNSDF